MISTIHELTGEVISSVKRHNKNRLFTVAISGIDGSGKGYITKKLQGQLQAKGYAVANINIDPWQQPIPVRLQKENPAENFYHHVFRWTDFFEQLIRPLQQDKSIRLSAMLIRTDADVYYPYTYDYTNLDILILEGICLFQERFDTFYDQKIWIECSFETAFQRALKRNSEKLDEEKLRHDYDNWYYPAQRFHFEKDHPQEQADIIFDNETFL